MAPVVDGIPHQFHRHSIVFCPLLLVEIQWQTCQLKLALKEINFIIGDMDLRLSAIS